MAIRVKNTHKYNDMCGRTAVIPCLNGFTAEVREINQCEWGSWRCYLALVPKDFPIDYKSKSKDKALYYKDDPTKKIFGIAPEGD
jgi:hypothetical protein